MERKKSEANGGDEEGGNESHYDDCIGIDGNNDGDFLVIFLVMMMIFSCYWYWRMNCVDKNYNRRKKMEMKSS